MLDPLQTFARWRTSCAEGLSQWLNWLLDEDLCAVRDEAQLREVIAKLHEARFTVAVVAELSRGKSELINALLFTTYGRRIVPSGAGRTTMCPTEFFCDMQSPPYIELLPIETRGQTEGIQSLRANPRAWERFELNTADSELLARDLLRVGEVQAVGVEEAQRLGLADETHTQPQLEIPRWRHARVNLHHPLLATGLTVLDTPGLNALGNEPELTYAVLPTSDAVLFLLAADVGVTRSDKEAWTRCLGHIPNAAKWVVLNKIDGMWDELTSDLEVRASIARQTEQCAKTLEVPVTQVFPLSALKGLHARINNDAAMLSKSRLAALEITLTQDLLTNRKTMLADRARAVVVDIFQEAQTHIEERLRQAMQQRQELDRLADTTLSLTSLHTQFEVERAAFDAEGTVILALRKVINAHTRKIFELLMPHGIDQSFAILMHAAQTGSVDTIKKALTHSLNAVQTRLIQARAESDAAVMALRNARNVEGLKVNKPQRLVLDDAIAELERLKNKVDLDLPLQPFLTVLHRKRIARTATALSDRMKTLAHDSSKDAELWLYSLVTPLERTLRDRQTAIRKRAETLQRMSDAHASLGEHAAVVDAVIAQETARHEDMLQRARAVQMVLSTAETTVRLAPDPAPDPQPIPATPIAP